MRRRRTCAPTGNSVPTRSPAASARAAWERCTGRATRGSDATSPSRSSRRLSRRTPADCAASSRRRGRPPRSTTPTSSSCTTSGLRRALPTSSRSCSWARRSAAALAGGPLAGAQGRRVRACRSPRASTPRTRRASSTATSSPRTSSSRPTAASRSWTSASPSSSIHPRAASRSREALPTATAGTEPAWCSARWATWRPSRSRGSPSTTEPTSSPSARALRDALRTARLRGRLRRRRALGDPLEGPRAPLSPPGRSPRRSMASSGAAWRSAPRTASRPRTTSRSRSSSPRDPCPSRCRLRRRRRWVRPLLVAGGVVAVLAGVRLGPWVWQGAPPHAGPRSRPAARRGRRVREPDRNPRAGCGGTDGGRRDRGRLGADRHDQGRARRTRDPRGARHSPRRERPRPGAGGGHRRRARDLGRVLPAGELDAADPRQPHRRDRRQAALHGRAGDGTARAGRGGGGDAARTHRRCGRGTLPRSRGGPLPVGGEAPAPRGPEGHPRSVPGLPHRPSRRGGAVEARPRHQPFLRVRPRFARDGADQPGQAPRSGGCSWTSSRRTRLC